MWKALSVEKPGANRVREIREEQLMTREELARRASVSLRTIWSVEAGHECRLETKRAILRALGIARTQHRIVFPRPGEAGALQAASELAAPAAEQAPRGALSADPA